MAIKTDYGTEKGGEDEAAEERETRRDNHQYRSETVIFFSVSATDKLPLTTPSVLSLSSIVKVGCFVAEPGEEKWRGSKIDKV